MSTPHTLTADQRTALLANPPLLDVLDADAAAADVHVALARRKITVRGAANAAAHAEQLLDELTQPAALHAN